MSYINNFKLPEMPRGWICPKYGRVYSPTTSICMYCCGKVKTDNVQHT